MKTHTECKGTCSGNEYTVPAGTEVIMLRDGRGYPIYAVKSERETAAITGNPHTAESYYLWVPDKAVESKPE